MFQLRCSSTQCLSQLLHDVKSRHHATGSDVLTTSAAMHLDIILLTICCLRCAVSLECEVTGIWLVGKRMRRPAVCAAALNLCLARGFFDASMNGELNSDIPALHAKGGPLPCLVAHLLEIGAQSSGLINLTSVLLCSRLLLSPELVPCYADQVHLPHLPCCDLHRMPYGRLHPSASRSRTPGHACCVAIDKVTAPNS